MSARRSSKSITTPQRTRPARKRVQATRQNDSNDSNRPRNRVPGYKVHAASVVADRFDVLDRAIDKLAIDLAGFESRTERREWRNRMRVASRQYCASLRDLAALMRQDETAFQDEVLRVLGMPIFRELAVAREVYFARRKRHCGKGPRGMWVDEEGHRRRRPPTVQRIRAMARTLSVDTPSVPVHRQVKAKPNGHRVTFAFSLPDQAMKRIVADIVDVACAPNPFDFGRANRGGQHGAAAAIRKSISRGEGRYFAVADLRDAYPSITAGHIADLIPLPRSVIRNVVTIPADLAIIASSVLPPPTGRRLPQGAVSSASILSALLGRSLRQIAGPHRMIVNQGDDVAIGTPTRAEAVLALRELTEELRLLRAGPLRFGRAEVQSPFSREKLNFCGYSHRWFYDTERLHCAPSDKSVEKMKVKLRSRLQRTPLHRREREQRSYLKAWSAAFPCWTRNKYSVSSIETTADIVRTRVRIAEIDRAEA